MPSPPAEIPGFSAPQIWEATLGQLLLRVTRQNYDTWLRNTVGLRFEGTTLVVSAANDLACDWLASRMRSVISQALTAVAGPGLQLRFEPIPEPDHHEVERAPLQPTMLPQAVMPLNPRFTFSTAIEADFNRLAFSASRDLGTGGQTYSPLFITGPSGSGKTHLLQAIAHEAASRRESCLLVSAEQFLSEFMAALRNKAGAAFRARYRDLSLLLIDDVEVLLGKKATLNEFCQTVSALHDQGRRVAVAGDRSAMEAASARFNHHLRWGLVAQIELPATDDRVRFIAARAASQGIQIPDEVQHYLALRVRTSIRDLEGAVNRVTALARISREPLNIDFAARALQPVDAQPSRFKPSVSPSQLLEGVCTHLDLSLNDITGPKRDRALTYGRHIAMYLLRQESGFTYSAIADLLGKRDHSTVVHACSQINKQLPLSPALRADLDAIQAILHSPSSAA